VACLEFLFTLLIRFDGQYDCAQVSAKSPPEVAGNFWNRNFFRNCALFMEKKRFSLVPETFLIYEM